ncbi:hypothetical protein EYC84_010317 [Monilinia fructicola]|uniref:NWD NACHT-NTPase N-terminal domain-containing protein n=1 Tax=Monilinia fructicola TaxID=38448 RepID=A0A5M9JG37_MONFR|nr:hypothetical protein EYC84_010317 [Monilinia fructicola]
MGLCLSFIAVVEIVQQFTHPFSWGYLKIPREEFENQLKESIVTLYWKILQYEATAINNFTRYAASIVREDDWKTLLKDVEDYKNNFMTDLPLNDSQTTRPYLTYTSGLVRGLLRLGQRVKKVIIVMDALDESVDSRKSEEEDIECDDERSKEQLMNRITLVLMNSVGGMFKWVTLQLAIMSPIEGQTFFPGTIQIQLQNIENRNMSLEQSLNDAYESVYISNNKLGTYNSSVSMALYKWLLCCEISLLTEEVVKIIELSFDHDPKFEKVTRNLLSAKVVLHCCSNFFIQSAEDTFRFAHLSVEEYLVYHGGVKAEFQPEKCHLFAMKMCLALLTSKRISPVSRQEHRPKGIKEARIWPRSPHLFSGGIPRLTLETSEEGQVTSLRNTLGAAFNLPEVIEIGLKKYREEIDASICTGLEPLLVAIRYSNPDSVKYLLDQDANPQEASGSYSRVRSGTVNWMTAD